MIPTRRWVLAIGVLIAAVAAYYVFSAGWLKPPTKPLQADCPGKADDSALLRGCVSNTTGRAVPRADVRLGLYDEKGVLVYKTSALQFYALGASFKVMPGQVPVLPNVTTGRVTVEAPHHLATSADLTVQVDVAANKLTFAPNPLWLPLTPVEPLLTLLFLVPGLVGVMLSVLYLSTSMLKTESSVMYFAATVSVAWTVSALGMIGMFLIWGDYLIPTFFLDTYLPVGVVVFSYLGTLTYVAFSLVEKPDGFFDEKNPLLWQRHIRVVGGRILIGPYVSAVAYLAFLSAFPSLGTGSGALLFAFVSGLYIKPVLEAIQGIGLRMLSAESQQKVAERLLRSTAPEAPAQPTSVASWVPNQALIDAVQRAKQELLAKAEVAGVVPGHTVDMTYAIRVYVYRGDVSATLPASMHGFPLDVTPIPPPDPRQPCRPVLSVLDWPKIQRDLLGEGGIAADSGVRCQRSGDLVLLADPLQTLFKPGAALFDVATAVHYVKPVVDDRADFFFFLIDPGSKFPQVGNYHICIFNDTQGTNYALPGNPGSHAPADRFGSARLRAVNILGYYPWTMRSLLHEMGHHWCAYATFRDSTQSADSHQLLIGSGQGQFSQDRMHWGLQFDAGRSPIDYDQVEWRPGPSGKFIGYELEQLDDKDEFSYCRLDLYLMGLIPEAEVGPLRIMGDAETQELIDGRIRRVRSTGKIISVSDVIRACGERKPAFEPRVPEYRVAFVLVSKSLGVDVRLAEARRLAFANGFEKATGSRARVTTSLG